MIKFRKSRFLLVTLLLIIGGAMYVIEQVLPYVGMSPQRVDVRNEPAFKNGIYPSSFGMNYEDMSIITSEGLTLHGYYLEADTPAGTMIVLHGIGDCKEHQYGLARKFLDLHLNVLLVDLRAHGMSEGDYCTFGAREKDDILRLIEFANYNHLIKPYGIFGNSLGGAIALQTLGITTELSFGIIESTFDRFDKVSVEYGEDMLGFRFPSLVRHIIARSGKIAEFDPFDVNPVESSKNIDVPIFMSHGTDDQKIPFSFGENNFSNLKSKNKIFYPVKGAGHYDLGRVGGNDYWNAVKSFILKWVNASPQL